VKRTILVCDCCKRPVPAVKTVDLCETHAAALDNLRERNRSKPKAKIKTTWNKANYGDINPRIMKLAEDRPMFNGATITKELKIPTHIAKTAVNQLIEAKQLVATGTGAGRKLSKAH
jgi:hypothetical protein